LLQIIKTASLSQPKIGKKAKFLEKSAKFEFFSRYQFLRSRYPSSKALLLESKLGRSKQVKRAAWSAARFYSKIITLVELTQD